MKSDLLSKSSFIRGLQCHKSLYLHKYRPELRDETTKEKQKLFETGHEIGILARGLFPGGVEVPFEGLAITEQIEHTNTLLRQGKEILYEPAFQYNNVFVKVDILYKSADGWEIYEVKGSTSVKDVYINDVAVQYYVLSGLGLTISKAYVVHINRYYVRHGGIEITEYFKKVDVTSSTRDKQSYVNQEIARQKIVLAGNMPVTDIGSYCDNPYECDFKGHCWSHVTENSVFELRGHKAKIFSFYCAGHRSMFDVPEGSLFEKQMFQVYAHQNQKVLFEADEVSHFLKSLWYPLYFLDFETFMPAIPRFEGTHPYQAIPFQYSLHYLGKKHGCLKHREYLFCQNADPREELIRTLVDHIPDNACVLAYNKTFEESVLRNLTFQFPIFKNKIDSIISNLKDLMDPFRRMSVYSWKQRGSYSLKNVLAAIEPCLSYDHMAIQNGHMATSAYSVIIKSDDPDEIQRIKQALLDYCQLDTLAMVRIYNELCDGFSQNERFDHMEILENRAMRDELEKMEARYKGYSEENTLLLYGLDDAASDLFDTLTEELKIDIYDVANATDLIAVPSFMAVINPQILSEDDIALLFQWLELLNEVQANPRMPIYFTSRPSFELPDRSDSFRIIIIDDLNEKYADYFRVEIKNSKNRLLFKNDDLVKTQAVILTMQA